MPRYFVSLTIASVIDAASYEEAEAELQEAADVVNSGWPFPWPTFDLEVEEYD
jgi:hypothetical protein